MAEDLNKLEYNTETFYRCPKCRNYQADEKCPNHPDIEIEANPPGTILQGFYVMKCNPSFSGVIYDS